MLLSMAVERAMVFVVPLVIGGISAALFLSASQKTRATSR